MLAERRQTHLGDETSLQRWGVGFTGLKQNFPPMSGPNFLSRGMSTPDTYKSTTGHRLALRGAGQGFYEILTNSECSLYNNVISSGINGLEESNF